MYHFRKVIAKSCACNFGNIFLRHVFVDLTSLLIPCDLYHFITLLSKPWYVRLFCSFGQRNRFFHRFCVNSTYKTTVERWNARETSGETSAYETTVDDARETSGFPCSSVEKQHVKFLQQQQQTIPAKTTIKRQIKIQGKANKITCCHVLDFLEFHFADNAYSRLLVCLG